MANSLHHPEPAQLHTELRHVDVSEDVSGNFHLHLDEPFFGDFVIGVGRRR
jgi:hypothetical protein